MRALTGRDAGNGKVSNKEAKKMALQTARTPETESDLYRVTGEDTGEAILWVKQSIATGLAPLITGGEVCLGNKGYIMWSFHSRHPSIEQAEGVRDTLLYDMDNPS